MKGGENCLPNKKAYPYPQGGNQWKCSQVEKIEQRLKKITNISHEFLLQNTKTFLKVVKTDFQESLISSGFRTTEDERVNGHNYTKFSAGLSVAPQNSRIRSNIYDITEMEFKEFEPRFKSAKTRFKFSTGLNLETFDAILNRTNHI